MMEQIRYLKPCTCCLKEINLCHLDIKQVEIKYCVRNKDKVAVWYTCTDCGSTMLIPINKKHYQQIKDFKDGGCVNAQTCNKCQKHQNNGTI